MIATTPPIVARRAYTLTELMAVVAILGTLAAMALPRFSDVRGDGHRAACHVNRAEIEVQVRLWRRAKGSLPLSNLSDIGIDPAYFPQEVPTCPVDGSSYTIDADGYVVGHDHP